MNAQMPAAAITAAVAMPMKNAVLFPLGACSKAISVVASSADNGSSDEGSMGSAVVSSVGSTVVGSVAWVSIAEFTSVVELTSVVEMASVVELTSVVEFAVAVVFSFIGVAAEV